MFSNKTVADGGIQYTGTQDGDVLNGMGAPFKTKMAALRRATMEGKDWSIAPVFDGFVARRKDAMPAETITPTASVGGNIATPAEAEKQPNQPLAVESIAPVDTESVASKPANQLAKVPKLKVTFGGRSYPVDSINEAQDKWVAFRDETGAGVSEIGNGVPITDEDGKLIARVSYNGRAWDSDEDNANLMAEAPTRSSTRIGQEPAPALEAPAPVAQPAAPAPKQVAAAPVANKDQAKALDRIAKGTAYFGNAMKAGEFVAKNGLKETHEAVKTGAARWDIQAKDSQPQGNTNGTQAPQTVEAAQERQEAPAADATVKGKKVLNSKFPPTEIRNGQTVRSNGLDYVVTGPVKGGISAERQETKQGGVTQTKTIFLMGDDAIAARIEAQKMEAAKPVTPQLPPAAPVDGLHISTGKADFAAGKPRALPSYYTKPGDKNSKDWYRGWDAANAAAPVAPAEKNGKAEVMRELAKINEQMPEGFEAADGPLGVGLFKDGKPVENVQGLSRVNGYSELLRQAKRLADNGQNDWTTIGRNKAGKLIVADKRGVRSYVENGIRVTETVTMKPVRGGGIELSIDGRSDEYRSVEEIEAEKPAEPAKAPEAPKVDALSEKEKAAKAKMFNALGKLAALASKNTRMNWTPEEEQQLLPIVIELFDGAMDLGSVTFQKAVRYVREFISANLDKETADAIPFETLQGAYIHTARKFKDQGATPGKEVMSFDSLEELEKSGDQADTGTKETNDDPRTEKQGSGSLAGVSAPEVGGTDGTGSGGLGIEPGSTSRRKGNSTADGQRGTAGRSGGDGSADTDSATTGGTAGGRGIAADGGRIPADSGAPNVAVPARSGRGARKGQASLLTQAGEVIPAAVPGTNFTITPDLKLGSGGEVTKYKDNIAAIRVLKLIESERRRATSDEQRVLARYVGWGGLANAFKNRVTGQIKPDWAAEVAELESLLSAKELKAASASTPNAHYTSETVTGFMWRAALRLGFNGGMVLEPSLGSGNFIGLMPASARKGSYVTGIELDGITARIASALYPQANIIASGFEKVALPEGTFDMTIGNPPFGKDQLRFQYNPKLNGKTIHNQFFLGSMEAVKPGGLQVMVVSRYLMDAQEAGSREALAIQGELLSAIRLPGSAFKGNAGTDVVTDILFLKKRSAAEQAALQYAYNERNAKVPAKESNTDRNDRMTRAAKLAAAMEWTTTAKVADPLGGEPMQVSQYFSKNPKMIAGVMDRSGSMQFGGDIDVKLPASELAARLDSLLESLPSMESTPISEEIDQRTQDMHKALGESMSIMAAGREIGSIYYDTDGALTEIVERVGENGKTIVSKNVVTARSPWSAQLAMNMDGLWFKEVAQLNDKGEKVKSGRSNVWVREVFANEADIPNGLRLGDEGFAKLQKLVEIRELYVEQISLETNSASTGPMEANRAKLRKAYEAFVAAHGFISEQKNATIVSEMPDEGLLLSLELKFRPAVSPIRAKAKGVKPSPARAEPNAILTRAVSIPPARKDNAASISDAVAIVLGEAGRIDVQRVAQLRNVTEDEALAELTEGDSPMAYLDPETNEVTEKNQYLSGNVRQKLIAAQDTGMKRNIEALTAVQPEPWTSDKVTAHMGASWIPPGMYANFVKSLLGRDASVTFSKLTNAFGVTSPGATAVDTSKWGTQRIPAVEMLDAILNNRRVAVYDGGGKDEPRVLNETETQSAIDKKKEIIEEFDNWIFKDGDRRQELTRLFNDLYNTRVNRQYDGSHMVFPGKVPDSIISFRRNQINAIWRGIVDRFTMYDHAVGAGKTFTGISRAMERKRMGLSNKPTIVVPNHLVSEWSTQAYRLYPGAKILAAGVKDLAPKNRRRLFAKIAAGDWDIVIIPHSSFKFIGISPETEERFINDELRVAQDALQEAEADAEPGQRFKPLSVKAAEALILKLENRMDVVRGKAGKDQLLTFEQMGIDDLTVDEAHEFKNLTYSTRLTDVRGLGPAAGSQKAFDLYTKMRILQESNGSAVFLTGTPISNSAVEMYTIMRYLAPNVLKENGLEHFDAFRAQYVQASEKPEPTEAGDGLKVVNRLGRNWSNMRSLMDGYYSVADVVTNDDIKAWYAEDNPGKTFPLPNVKGGGRRTVKAVPTATQQLLIDELIAGYNGLPNIEDVRERNSERLRLMDKARKLALHAKAWDTSLTDEAGGKLDKVVDESMRLYKAFESDKGTQLIFLDRSVPKSKGDDKIIKEYDALRAKLTESNATGDEKGQREAIESLEKFDPQEMDELRAAQNGGWNAYQHMADGLIAKGVPKEQIAFIQNFNTDAEKKALFEAVNDGTIRFLFGSSARMGAGMNVQERLVGLHHVDVTWKPSDIEQREGRIIRQGNALLEKYGQDFEVEIMAYVTERSIDAKMWDLNSTKLRMVNGIRYYDGEFEMDFDDDAAIDMAEIAAIASGDPLMLERIKVNTVIEDLYRKRKSYNRRIESAGDSLRRAEQ